MAIIYANSPPTIVNVQAAIDAASHGDIVVVPPGTETWATPVVCTKGITLHGSGIDITTIIDGTSGAWEDEPLVMSTVAGYTTRVVGFTFDGQNSAANSWGIVQIKGAYNEGNFRVDHNKFKNIKIRGFFAKGSYGVVNNNIFLAPYDLTAQGVSILGDGADAWLREYTPGSVNAVYVEDNQFDYAYPNDGALDAYHGARYVFRHNTVINTQVGHHGLDSGGYRSTFSWEIYENLFTKETSGNIRLFHSRGGTGVIFNNTYTGNYAGMELANYRSCASYDPWGQCNGENPIDGNEEANGYPCMDQNGRTTGQVLMPIYAWNNTLNSSPTGLTVVNACPEVALHIVEDRDFYNGIEKPGYVPYTYPHPLRNEFSSTIDMESIHTMRRRVK